MTGRERQQQIEARRLRRNILASLIAVKGHLDTPYPDDPRWTPWTRFIERTLRDVDELGALAARLSGLQDTLAKLDKATTALRMIEENEHGESWSAGVAMSALSAMEEVGYPKPHPRPDLFGPYTMGVKLCDDDGIVRSGRFHSGTDYPCTGHAHFAGEHIECTSPAHRAALALNADGEAAARQEGGTA